MSRIPLRVVILAIIATLQVFSAVFVVPGLGSTGGSVFRLVLAGTGAILFIATGLRLTHHSTERALAFAVLLTFWMTISLTWSPEPLLGLQQVSYLATTLILIYVFEVLTVDEEDFLRLGLWIGILGGLITAASYYEISTGIHFFRSSLQDTAELNRSLSHISDDLAWFSFDNPNDLAVHLAACLFIITPILSRNRLGWMILFLFVGVEIVLLEQLGARIVIASVLVFVLFFIVAGFQKQVRSTFFMFAGVIAAMLVVLATLLVFSGAAELLDVSTFVRLELIKSALAMGEGSNLLGIGTGAFESEMWSAGFVAATYGIINPHNAVSRIFAENGVLGLLVFGFLVLGPALVLRLDVRPSRLSAFIAAGSVGLLLLLSVGSNPIASSTLQMVIAYLWVGRRLAEQNRSLETQYAVPSMEGLAWPRSSRGKSFPLTGSRDN